MPEYRVRWELDVEAASERAAGEHCWADYFQHGHDASEFHVQPLDSSPRARWALVDVTNAQNPFITFEYPHRALHLMAKKIVEQGGDINEVIDMLEKPWKWQDTLSEVLLDSIPGHTVIRPEEPDLLA